MKRKTNKKKYKFSFKSKKKLTNLFLRRFFLRCSRRWKGLHVLKIVIFSFIMDNKTEQQLNNKNRRKEKDN